MKTTSPAFLKTSFVAALSLVSLLLPLKSEAAPVVEYTFENGLTTGWATNPSGSSSTLSVVNDPLRANNKVLKLDDTLAASVVHTSGAFGSTLSTGEYRLTLQIYIATSGGEGSDYEFNRRFSVYGSDTSTYTRVRTLSSEGVITGVEMAAFNRGTGWQTATTIETNKWYDLTQTFNVTTKTWTYSYSDTETGSVIYTSPELNFFGATATNFNVLLFAETVAEGRGGLIYIDNVVVEAIPEPGAIGLAAVAAGFLLMNARRSRRSA